MPMRITMLQARLGESGSVLAEGSTHTVSDDFGLRMVGAGYALDTDDVRLLSSQTQPTLRSNLAVLQQLAVEAQLIPGATYTVGLARYRALSASTYASETLLQETAGNYQLLNPEGGVLAISEVTPFVTRTTTGTAFAGACELAGWDCIVAAGNITIYDNTSATGTIVVPTTTLAVGRTEFVWKRALTIGCHVVLSGAATVNVLVG